MAHNDVKVGLAGLIIGVILGATTALMGSEAALEGLIIRRPRNDRPNSTVIQMLLDHTSRVRRW
ncbi:hypothetical protein HYZ99_04705 [Candidatus Peregrinibacteria bacterium]|nr:hypothetical protein [Candidatus Peregrinibacteria bacterium]